MCSMLTLCIKCIPNINQDYGIDIDLVSIPRYYILVSYRSQNYGIKPSLVCVCEGSVSECACVAGGGGSVCVGGAVCGECVRGVCVGG